MKAADEYASAIQYVESQAPLAARLLAQRIMLRIRSLRRWPESGGFIAEDESKRYRQVIEGSYRIIYRFDGKAVFVLSIYHSARLLSVDQLE